MLRSGRPTRSTGLDKREMDARRNCKKKQQKKPRKNVPHKMEKKQRTEMNKKNNRN